MFSKRFRNHFNSKLIYYEWTKIYVYEFTYVKPLNFFTTCVVNRIAGYTDKYN